MILYLQLTFLLRFIDSTGADHDVVVVLDSGLWLEGGAVGFAAGLLEATLLTEAAVAVTTHIRMIGHSTLAHPVNHFLAVAQFVLLSDGDIIIILPQFQRI